MGSKNRVLSIYLLFILITPVFIAGSVASSENTITVQRFAEHIMWWKLNGDEKISGTISVTHSIKFWITDPDGFILNDFGKVTEPTTFEISANRAGNYTLHFSNLYIEDVQVHISYDIVQPTMAPIGGIDGSKISNLTPPNSPIVEAITVLVVSIVILIAFVSIYTGVRKIIKNSKPNDLPPPPPPTS